MYKLLLILKYLRRKLAPMFAAVAVMLCTMMVIIVLSVMGGFLDLLRTSAKKLTGDMTVSAISLTGFPHYDELLKTLDQLPEVKIASPVVRTYGLLNITGQTIPVRIEGIRPREFSQIVEYRDTLRWSTKDLVDQVNRSFSPKERQSGRLGEMYRKELKTAQSIDLMKAGLTLEPPAVFQHDAKGKRLPGMVVGIEVTPTEDRDKHGHYHFANSAVGGTVTLTMLPLTRRGDISAAGPSYGKLVVVNEFKSGLFDVDANVVFVPFEYLQKKLDMEPREVTEQFDPITGQPTGGKTMRPGRTSEVIVAGAPGYTDMQVRDAVAKAVAAFSREHPDVYPPLVQTWREVHAGLLSAVKNETGLVTFLFAIISLVAVVMVATTFYMIVLEKTRDIGVLRAIGASRAGIRHIFLGYGLAIGVIGAAAGFGLAWAIVTHLNQLQNVIADWTGWRMWDPQTYFFDKIPDHVDPVQAGVIVAGAIVASVIGAFIPALLAARQDPVEALRYE